MAETQGITLESLGITPFDPEEEDKEVQPGVTGFKPIEEPLAGSAEGSMQSLGITPLQADIEPEVEDIAPGITGRRPRPEEVGKIRGTTFEVTPETRVISFESFSDEEVLANQVENVSDLRFDPEKDLTNSVVKELLAGRMKFSGLLPSESAFGAPQEVTPESSGQAIRTAADLIVSRYRGEVGQTSTMEDEFALFKRTFPTLNGVLIEGGERIAFSGEGDTTVGISDPVGADPGDLNVIATRYIANLENLATVGVGVATGGSGFLVRAGAEVAGSVLGRAADIELAEKAGLDTRPGTEKTGDLIMTGMFALGGEAVGGLIVGTGNAVRSRRGVIVLDEMKKELVESADRLGLPPPTPGQLNMILARNEARISVFVDDFEKIKSAQRTELLKKMEDELFEAQSIGSVSDEQLTNIISSQKADIRRHLEDVDSDVVGAAEIARDSINEAVFSLKLGRDEKYRRASLAATEDINFQIDDLQGLLKEQVLSQPLGRPKGSAELGELDLGTFASEFTDPLERREALGVIEDTFGKETADDVRDQLKGVKLPTGIDDRFRVLAERITKLSPDIGHFQGFSGYRQLQAIKTNLFDLSQKTPGAASKTNSQRLAGEAHQLVKESLENPSGGGELFRIEWTKANTEAAKVAGIIERGIIKDIRQADPDKLAGTVTSYLNRNSTSGIKLLKKILPKEDFRKVQRVFQTEMFADSDNIITKLDAFGADSQALKELLPAKDRRLLEITGNKIRQVNNSPAATEMTRAGGHAERATNLAKFGTKAETEAAIKIGGDPYKFAVRYGVLSDILDSSTTTLKGSRTMDFNAFTKSVDRWEKKGILPLVFDDDAIKILKDRRFYASMLNDLADVGAPFVGAATAQQAFNPVNAITDVPGWIFSVGSIMSNRPQAKLWLSPRTRRVLYGKDAGKAALDADMGVVAKGLNKILPKGPPVEGGTLKTSVTALSVMQGKFLGIAESYKDPFEDLDLSEATKKLLEKGSQQREESDAVEQNDKTDSFQLPAREGQSLDLNENDMEDISFNFEIINDKNSSDSLKKRAEASIKVATDSLNISRNELRVATISDEAKNMLRSDPSVDGQFDEVFGEGSAKLVLRG